MQEISELLKGKQGMVELLFYEVPGRLVEVVAEPFNRWDVGGWET